MLNIVLYQPEIPPNTGNIIRTCYSTGAKLHIIKPISFDLSPKWLKRSSAGKDLSDIKHEIHSSYEEFNKKYGDKVIFYITRYGKFNYSSIKYDELKDDVWVMFGRESTGIPMNILKDNFKRALRIPMTKESRSLNLANCVAIVSYEIMRQLSFKNMSEFEVQKGKDWILN